MPNLLARESSPYLLQHKDNPVQWYPWGELAFTRAREENKPIFLSIGYSTCYWCHVMERDSFEKRDVAELLNRHFIPIKVDREERPDVDQIYMDVVIGLTGHGGWPMSVFLTPDLKPFWGGTFFYRQQFLSILTQLAGFWGSEREKILNSGASITEAMHSRETGSAKVTVSAAIFDSALRHFRESFDSTWGGFGAAPKFPPAGALRFLMKRDTGIDMVRCTLDAMARGGIHDHVAGGFSRYSTDPKWHIPHFEKMLYDNALLAQAYVDAFQITRQQSYRTVAERIFEFVLRELCDPGGGFYSALDAGEVDKEGEFYAWSREELVAALGTELFTEVSTLFEIEPGGNFEDEKIVLCLRRDLPLERILDTKVQESLKLLFVEREKRRKLHRDEKIISAWNGLMISALARAAFVFDDARWKKAAESAAEFVLRNLVRDGVVFRSFAGNRAALAGYLDDYTALVEGFLALYFASGDSRWYVEARRIQEAQDRLFWLEQGPNVLAGYIYSTAPELIVQKREIHDGATPSGTSMALCNLATLSLLSSDSVYRERALTLCSSLSQTLTQYPFAMVKALEGVSILIEGATQIVLVCGAEGIPHEVSDYLRKNWLPRTVLIIKEQEARGMPDIATGKTAINGRATLYVCKDFTCTAPLNETGEMVDLLRSLK